MAAGHVTTAPPRQVDWTFESDGQKSSQRFASTEAAIVAAGEWLNVCAINSFYPSIRIVKVNK